MSQSRFSIVLVGVSALLRRPLVSRLRPADGERSSWVFFAARVGRFDSGFHLPLRKLPSAGWFFRSASWPSGFHLPLRKLPSAGWFFRSASWPSGSLLPLLACTASEWPLGEFVLLPSVSELPLGGLAFGFTASEIAAGRVRSSAFRFGVALGGLAFGLTASAFRPAPLRGYPRWVGLRVHRFRFSACTDSGLPSAGWFFHSSGWFFRLPLRKLPSAGWPWAHCFRFSACAASELPLGGLAFGFTASAFRHAPIRGCPRRVGSSAFRFGNCPRRVGSSASRFGDSARRVGLRAHRFRFSACTVSELPLGELAFGLTASAFRHAPLRSCRSASWPSGFRFGNCPRRVGSSVRRVGLRAHCFRFSVRTASEWLLGELVLSPSVSEIALGGLAFGLTASAFRHALLRRLPSAGWFFRPAGWSSGSLLPLFGMRRSAPPHRRSEDRRSTPTPQLFHFKTLIPTC